MHNLWPAEAQNVSAICFFTIKTTFSWVKHISFEHYEQIWLAMKFELYTPGSDLFEAEPKI